MILIYVLAELLFSAICLLFINWWAPLFAQTREVWDRGTMYFGVCLPKWLTWADTFDADLDIRQRLAGRVPTYWTRVLWLYRNHAYGFAYYVLGRPFNPDEWVVHRYTEAPFEFYATGPDGAFNWTGIRFGLRFKIGWKAWNYYNEHDGTWDRRPWGPLMRVPFTFSISLAR